MTFELARRLRHSVNKQNKGKVISDRVKRYIALVQFESGTTVKTGGIAGGAVTCLSTNMYGSVGVLLGWDTDANPSSHPQTLCVEI